MSITSDRATTPPVAPTPSHADSWDLAASYKLSQSAIAGDVLAELADSDERIAVLTADLKFSNRTAEFETRHPDRFFNLGIAEQNMVSVAAGMATVGYVPYVASFASFLGLLCVEQIRTDLAYPGLPVRVLAHHAGISMGFYGTSHHATEDLGIMRTIAGLTVIAPCDAPSLAKAVRTTVDYPGPIYFRLGRGREATVYDDTAATFEVGKIGVLRDGDDLTIAANGVTVAPALEAAERLATEGVQAAVLDVHTTRPFDAETLCRHVGRSGRLLVAEEHNVYGGVATTCADALVDNGVGPVLLERLGMPVDDYALVGPPTALWRHYGMDAEGIHTRARELHARMR